MRSCWCRSSAATSSMTRRSAWREAALALGFAHRKLNYYAMNVDASGAVIAAPRAADARTGLPRRPEVLRAHPGEEYPRGAGRGGKAAGGAARARARERAPGKSSRLELDLAARMAVQSCRIMLWQQAVVAGRGCRARRLAQPASAPCANWTAISGRYWPLRNKGTTAKCSAFLRWRMEDYRRGTVYFPPEAARMVEPTIPSTGELWPLRIYEENTA